MYLRIKAIPGSNITELMEIMETENGKTYKIKLKAPPEKGKANQELIRFLSQEFKTSKEKISIISGHVSSLKLIKITH
ncbi:hypothetical protein A2335_03440 [Candidatus Peregrinibacteria bacterium RIFOXYB2_FULL_32_7]|nr:MAG: hypothetical protein A2335_03440 [Candidatus Peregrinibacteria bacterium RIFOXYB2_FULL_32_7]